MPNNKSIRRRARKQREAPQKAFWRSTPGKWEVDHLNDSGLDVVLDAGDAHTTWTSEVVHSVLHAADSVKEPPPHIRRSPAVPRKSSMSIGFFDLPSEIRTCIYELYWLGIAQPSGKTLRDLQQRFWFPLDTLKPKLICHQFRDEYEDAWAGIAKVELPGQTLRWSHIPTAENNSFDRHESLQHLFTFVRDWLHKSPSHLRHRLRHLRVTYEPEIHFWPRNSDVTNALQHIRGEDIANSMERLVDVHSQLCIVVRIFGPKYWDSSRNEYAIQTLEVSLKQQTPEKVPARGGAEWVCVNRALTAA